MAEIKETLIGLNHWWKGEFQLRYKPREIYQQIQKFLSLPQMIAVSGLRRVGKTTLLFKIVEDAIKKGLEPKNILYFSFDEFRQVQIREILRGYEELMELNLRKSKHLLL